MATDQFDALAQFNQVQGTFGGDQSAFGTGTLTTIKNIATDAEAIVTEFGQIPYLTENAINGEAGSSIVASPEDPVEPSSNDTSLYTEATSFLDWLRDEALSAATFSATFPDYTTLFSDEPPVAPEVDTSTPSSFDITTPSKPSYTVPTWNDSSAWSGGDLTDDGSIGALMMPFEWTEMSHTSAMLNGGTNILYEAIKRDVESLDYGIDNLDEGRLWDRARERENRLGVAEAGKVIRLFSAGGFTMPTGAAQAALSRVLSDVRDKVSSINREIMIQKSALYLEAKKIALANGLDLEKTTMDFYHKEADLTLRRLAQEITSTVEVGTYNISRFKMRIDAYASYAQGFTAQVAGAKGVVEMYASEVEAEKAKADANKSIYDALIAKNRVVIDQYVAALQGFQTVMDARVKYHGVLADVYKSQVTQMNAYTDATKGAFDLVDKQQKNLVDFRVNKYNAQVAATKAKVDEILGFVAQKIDQLKTQAQSVTSIAVAAMSAMNVNLGLSVSASTSVGGSENHSYDKTKGTDSGKTESYNYNYDKTKSDWTYHEEHYINET